MAGGMEYGQECCKSCNQQSYSISNPSQIVVMLSILTPKVGFPSRRVIAKPHVPVTLDITAEAEVGCPTMLGMSLLIGSLTRC